MADMDQKPRYRWLLIASLALNVLIIGLAIGIGLRGGPPERHSRNTEAGMRGIARGLPEDHRKALGKEVNAQWQSTVKVRGGMRRDLIAALEAEPFDPAAVDAILTAHHSHMSANMQSAGTAFLKVLSEMSAEDRANFVQNLQKKRSKKWGAKPPRRQE